MSRQLTNQTVLTWLTRFGTCTSDYELTRSIIQIWVKYQRTIPRLTLTKSAMSNGLNVIFPSTLLFETPPIPQVRVEPPAKVQVSHTASSPSIPLSFAAGFLLAAVLLVHYPSLRRLILQTMSILCHAIWVRCRLLSHHLYKWAVQYPIPALGASALTVSIDQSSELRQAVAITCEVTRDACIIVVKRLCKRINYFVHNFFGGNRRPPRSGFFYWRALDKPRGCHYDTIDIVCICLILVSLAIAVP